ncbi:thermonuclease family protein [Candidatus Bipolaricaulota bacterium]|nr:thermonuclease family protein [Candidatus Bipolaricaulota bacterium]
MKLHFYSVKYLTALILTLALFSFPLAAAQTPDPERAEITSQVIEIHNGDTIKLANGMKVRYLGLDTPETHHSEKPVEYFGVKASKFNQQLVGGKKVKLEYDVQKKDQYDRHLAYVYVIQDGEWINVNAELLREGYAQVYTIPPNVKYADYFLELEREAEKTVKASGRHTVKVHPSSVPRKSRRKWIHIWAK